VPALRRRAEWSWQLYTTDPVANVELRTATMECCQRILAVVPDDFAALELLKAAEAQRDAP